ncbi:MAG: Ger(x)C family spore germination protein [Solirubrobacterales bacterium]
MNWKRTVLAAVLIATCLSSSGCWDRRELQDVNIITAIGFDRITSGGKPVWKLSTYTIIMSGSGSGKSAQASNANTPNQVRGTVRTAYGATIYDAVRNASTRESRQLFFGQTLIAVVGQKTARQGIEEIIDFLARHRDLRLRLWFAVSNTSAEICLQASPEIETLLSTELNKMMAKNEVRGSKSVSSDLLDVVHGIMTPGHEPLIARIVVIRPPEPASPLLSNQNPGQPPNPAQNTVALRGSYLVHAARLVTAMSEDETQGYTFLVNQASGGVIPVTYHSGNPNISLVFRRVKAKIRPEVVNHRIVFRIRIDLETDLQEVKENRFHAMTEKDRLAIEKLAGREVERRCKLALKKAKETKTDIFGFGEILHQRNPKVWHQVASNWDDVFSTLDVRIQAHVDIEHTGLITDPLMPVH